MSDALDTELQYQQAVVNDLREAVKAHREALTVSTNIREQREVNRFEQDRTEALRQNRPDHAHGYEEEIRKVREGAESTRTATERDCNRQDATVKHAQDTLDAFREKFTKDQNQLVEQTRHLDVAEAKRQMDELRERQRAELEARMRENTRSLGR
jgi:hypothetical protein